MYYVKVAWGLLCHSRCGTNSDHPWCKGSSDISTWVQDGKKLARGRKRQRAMWRRVVCEGRRAAGRHEERCILRHTGRRMQQQQHSHEVRGRRMQHKQQHRLTVENHIPGILCFEWFIYTVVTHINIRKCNHNIVCFIKIFWHDVWNVGMSRNVLVTWCREKCISVTMNNL